MTSTPNITDIKGTYWVPAYQRGYKWRPKDVEHLIRDLAEYDGESSYYMQPLVVANAQDNKWIVVDGQQRLTTFYLIWRTMYEHGICKDKPSFALEYENREVSTDYIETKKHEKDTPDIRHFIAAEEKVMELRESLEDAKFQTNFFAKARFIWYELEDAEEGPKMFERLNGKRIALTDEELCKVLLLSDSSRSRRSERAIAWQNMEYTLQQDRFYDFISKEKAPNDRSRMGLLLGLVTEKKQRDAQAEYEEFPLYSAIRNKLKKGENIWDLLVKTFHTLETWYDSPFEYNLVGFLVNAGITTVRELISSSSKSNIDEIVKNEVVKWRQGIDVKELQYRHPKTKSVLLLFNILCDLYDKGESKKRPNERYGFFAKFPFDIYKSLGHDKEHVHATNSEPLKLPRDIRSYCRLMIAPGHLKEEYIKILDKELIPHTSSTYWKRMKAVAMADVLNTTDESTEKYQDRLNKAINDALGGKDVYTMIASKINELHQEKGDMTDESQNSIGNLALLCAAINRDQAYAAAPFAVKRAIIAERMKQGVFVPKGTERMFNKAFIESPENMFSWVRNEDGSLGSSDTEAFLDYLEKTLNQLQ